MTCNLRYNDENVGGGNKNSKTVVRHVARVDVRYVQWQIGLGYAG